MSSPDGILSKINGPEDLKSLPEKSLDVLAQELRDYIIDVVSRNGGHLASNLGVVELTIALHRVFSSPSDKLIWDVGHQCYSHKILTGRRDQFVTIRKLNGLSGFPKPAESPHDIVETGHSSTAISEGLGLLIGQRMQGQDGKVVAVVGDGALTGGIALEGLNQAGHLANDLILIVNDNNMSIGKNVGAISSYLSRLTTTPLYQNVKRRLDSTVKRIPVVGQDLNYLLRQLEKGAKAVILPDTLFSDFGFQYVGPIDGHNIPLLIHVLRNVKRLDQPIVVHVKTIKGRGYAPAEDDPANYHGVSAFSVVDGKFEKKQSLTYTEAFSEIAAGLGARDNRVVTISAAMTASTGLGPFQERFPGRFFDVGITEQHAVTFAAGLARSGQRPIVAIYSTFMQRAVDQVIHDVALPRLPVVIALDRAGLVGEDGETHHGVYDVPLFRAVPGLTILAPASRDEMELMFRHAIELNAPVIVRYSKSPCAAERDSLALPLETGRGVFVRKAGGDVLLLSLGGILPEVLQAAELLKGRGIDADVYNLRFVKPLDVDHLAAVAADYSRIFVVEEGSVVGGIGEHISHSFYQRRVPAVCYALGIPDGFVCHGTRAELLALCGIDSRSIAEFVENSAESAAPLKIYRALP